MDDLSELRSLLTNLNAELRVTNYRVDALERDVEARADGTELETLRGDVADVRGVLGDTQAAIRQAVEKIDDARHRRDTRAGIYKVLIPALFTFLGILAGLLFGGA